MLSAFQSNAFQNNAFQIENNGGVPPTPTITGGHFLPAHGKRKATLSNILTIYEKAKALPRKETKELRDAISKFVAPEVAVIAAVPDMEKINYEALEANAQAYERFAAALANIESNLEYIQQKQIVIQENKQKEDDELLLLAFICCTIN